MGTPRRQALSRPECVSALPHGTFKQSCHLTLQAMRHSILSVGEAWSLSEFTNVR